MLLLAALGLNLGSSSQEAEAACPIISVSLLRLNCLNGFEAPGPGERIVALAYKKHFDKIDRHPNGQCGCDQEPGGNRDDFAFCIYYNPNSE